VIWNSIGNKVILVFAAGLLVVGLAGTYGFGAEHGAGALAAVIGVTAVASLLCGWWLRRMIVRPIDEAVRVAESLAAGDLTVETRHASSDEFGVLHASLGRLRRDLAGAVTRIH